MRSRPVQEQRSPDLYPVVSLVSISRKGHDHHSACDPRALASCRLSLLLALEIASRGRPAADRSRFAGIDPAQMRLPERDHVVETFPSDRADQSFRVRILPRRA